jgi:acyl-CoA synthetase (AMP-forming)/AMP-acid ligase II
MSSQLESNTVSNIVEILQHRAVSQGEKTAYIFLKDGENIEIRLTYQELDLKAKAIAFQLQQLVAPGSRALLVYPYNKGLEFITAFFGCLYAGIVAVPCHPPKNRLTTFELQGRLESADATVILTNSGSFNKLNLLLSGWGKSTLHCLDTDKIELPTDDWTAPEITGDTLAFLQYTSGSTGEPKGVMVTHSCLLQNQEILKRAFGHTADLVGASWLPLFHDMGLIGNVIQPIYVGGTCVMMSPVSFVQKPVRWLRAISKYRATTSGAPNFAYDLLSDRLTTEQLASLDLSCWEVAFCGAEPVQPLTLEEFSFKFAPCGFKSEAFYPCYGMAEATLMITGGDRTKPPKILYLDEIALEQNKVVLGKESQLGTKSFVSAGYPWLDGKISIVDPQTLKACEPDRIGEVWYSSSSVGKGYWQLKEQTQQTFQASLQDRQYLRTGDLGFMQDRELYITGRLHDVLVFWGLNHYPQHLEQTVEQCHLGLKPNSGAAFSVEVEGKQRLVIAQEIERTYRKSIVMEEVVEAIRWQVFQQHFIDIYGVVLLLPGKIPKTSSGKVQRAKCKAMFLDQSLDVWQEWYHQDAATSDVTGLFQRYTNPLTYIKMLSAIAKGKIRRGLYLMSNFRSLESLDNK